jgi:type IX secretion system PorP/SprF family membrane protein
MVTMAQVNPANNQYLMNQSMLNPAYNGVHDMANITANTRGQWVGIEGAPFTHILSMYSTFSDHSAAGLLFINDNFGINSTVQLSASYAYRLDFYGNYLSFGLQGGMINYIADFDKLDQEVADPGLPSGRLVQREAAFGFGMMYKTDRLFFGVASPKMVETDVQDDGLIIQSYKRAYNASFGFLVEPVAFLKIKPSVLVRYSEGEEPEVDLNGQMQVSDVIWLGVATRNFNSVGANIIYTSDEIYHFGYSFEFPLNDIGEVVYGTHELMISIDMKLSPRHKLGGRFF